MKQQVLEARIARIEAIAKDAIKNGGHASALVEIIRIAGRPA